MDFQNYRELSEKVDAFFTKTNDQHQSHMQCKMGCHSCCKPDLNVSKIEKEYIKAGLDESKIKELKNLAQENPHQSTRCNFLNKEGACSIYNLRPIICRSHGIPIQFKDNQDNKKRDVCYLNFQKLDINTLKDQDILNIDTLNVMLATLNMFHFKEDATKRYKLELASILS